MKTKIEKIIEAEGSSLCIVKCAPATAAMAGLGDAGYFKPSVDERTVVEVYRNGVGEIRYRDSTGDSWEEAKLIKTLRGESP